MIRKLKILKQIHGWVQIYHINSTPKPRFLSFTEIRKAVWSVLMESARSSLVLKMGLKLPSAAFFNGYNLKHAVIKKNTYIIMNNYMED